MSSVWRYRHPFNGVSFTERKAVADAWADFGPVTEFLEGETVVPPKTTLKEKAAIISRNTR